MEENMKVEVKDNLRAVYTLSLAEFLISKGYLKYLRKVERNKADNKKSVFVFYETSEIKELINYYVDNKKKD